jgi:hypothetical protein
VVAFFGTDKPYSRTEEVELGAWQTVGDLFRHVSCHLDQQEGDTKINGICCIGSQVHVNTESEVSVARGK